MNNKKCNFGIMGLGVMGRMIAQNMERNGFTVAGFDLDIEKVKHFDAGSKDNKLLGCDSIEKLIDNLETPRRILMMVPAGKAVDEAIAYVKPFLSKGDLLIDGGNTFFADTNRRNEELESSGIIYIGTGISGGEQGALWGPSIMPGGQKEAWELVKPIFEAIAAKVNGEPCVAYMGEKGAGHYVKMVHNGIEYGDMQLIAETYDIMKRVFGLSNDELSTIFDKWNRGDLGSYLIEITRDIFKKKDHQTNSNIIDLILDEAQQKGTGKWTSQNALDLGAPTPTINAAVESRIISSLKQERVVASKILKGPDIKKPDDLLEAIHLFEKALYVAKICSYAQGFGLMKLAKKEYHFEFNFAEIARIWSGGCIIRAKLLDQIRKVYIDQSDLTNLMLAPYFSEIINKNQNALRRIVMLATENGIPVLGFASALAYYDAYRTIRLPSNLTQAQRDFFGAHTYRRTDRDGVFHTQWN